jgi:hypothetical protein
MSSDACYSSVPGADGAANGGVPVEGKGLDPEGLGSVIILLRKARNEVVWTSGQWGARPCIDSPMSQAHGGEPIMKVHNVQTSGHRPWQPELGQKHDLEHAVRADCTNGKRDTGTAASF